MKTKVTKTYVCDRCGESFESEEECKAHEHKAHTLVGVFSLCSAYDGYNGDFSLMADCVQLTLEGMEDEWGENELDSIWGEEGDDGDTVLHYATIWSSDHDAMKEKFKAAVLKWCQEQIPIAIAAIDDMDCYDDDDDDEEE